MADYRQTDIVGTRWRRCCGIDIHNPFGKTGQVNFREQDLALVGGQAIQLGTSNITIPVDMGKSFPILNPVTGDVTEQMMTHAELYVLLYSAYIAEATARDQQEAALPEEVTPSE